MSHNTNTALGGATSPVASLHGPQVAGKSVTILSAAGNVCEIGGDYSVWDTVANKFVHISTTNIGTTTVPKL